MLAWIRRPTRFANGSALPHCGERHHCRTKGSAHRTLGRIPGEALDTDVEAVHNQRAHNPTHNPTRRERDTTATHQRMCAKISMIRV